MRDSKSFFILVFALVLITISIVLITIWGYNFYYHDRNNKALEPISEKPGLPDSAAGKPVVIIGQSARDSLQVPFNNTTEQLDNRKDSGVDNTKDSLALNLNTKLAQYDSLRNEIADILRNKTSAKDMVTSGEKLTELQNKIDEVEAENKRLNRLLAKLIREQSVTKPESITAMSKRIPSSKKSIPSLFSVINLQLISLENKNGKLFRTSHAAKTNKLVGAFQFKNNSEQITSFEVEVIVVQPNGMVLQNAALQSGNFETPSGKKVYSAKFNFECLKGVNKTLNFSLSADKFLKGNYKMLVYHKGLLIGRLVKYLA